LQRTRIGTFANADHPRAIAFELFELLRSLLGERSENVAKGFAEPGELRGKELEPPQNPPLA
jgi:hypothetical protein